MKTNINSFALMLGLTPLLLANSCCLAATTRPQGQIKGAYTKNFDSRYLNCLLRQNDQIKAAHRNSSDVLGSKHQAIDVHKMVGCSSGTLIVNDRLHEIHNKPVTASAIIAEHKQDCCQESLSKNNTTSSSRAAVEFSQATLPFIANGIYPYGL